MSWINELSVQRRTWYSNGLFAQTDDCKRVEELILTMAAKHPEPLLLRKRDRDTKDWIPERWLILDGWNGLFEIVPKKDDWEEKFITDAKKQGGELRTLLPRVSEELATGNTVVIMQNVLLADKYINNALRSWSTSRQLSTVDSTVIVFTEDVSMFPQNVWSKMKTIDVPKSLADERLRMIRERQEGMEVTKGFKLSEKDEQAAVRILAGMNHDQIDAAVVESLTRYQQIRLGALSKTKGELIGRDPSLDIIQRPKFGFEAIGGYSALKGRLMDDIILPLQNPKMAEDFDMKPPRGSILFGPPGTGKTALVKAISKETNMSVLIFRPENVMSKYVGESERGVKRAFKIADSMAPVIFFVDELDRLTKRSGSGDSGAQVHREIFSMFLEKLGDEDREWFFIGCTNLIENIDEAMRRTGRIDTIVPVPFPDKRAREEIFKIHSTVKRTLPLNDDISFKILSTDKNTGMWSGSDVEELVKRTAKYVMKDSIKNGGKLRNIAMTDFEEILSSFNVDVDANKALQRKIKEQAKRLTNDTRLMDIFEEGQKVSMKTQAEKGKNYM